MLWCDSEVVFRHKNHPVSFRTTWLCLHKHCLMSQLLKYQCFSCRSSKRLITNPVFVAMWLENVLISHKKYYKRWNTGSNSGLWLSSHLAHYHVWRICCSFFQSPVKKTCHRRVYKHPEVSLKLRFGLSPVTKKTCWQWMCLQTAHTSTGCL